MISDKSVLSKSNELGGLRIFEHCPIFVECRGKGFVSHHPVRHLIVNESDSECTLEDDDDECSNLYIDKSKVINVNFTENFGSYQAIIDMIDGNKLIISSVS